MAGVAIGSTFILRTPARTRPSEGETSNRLIAGVVGPDQGQLPPTSPFALFSNGGERERERAWYTQIYFRTLRPNASSKTASFQGGRNFLSFRIRTHRLYNKYEYIMFFFSVKLRLE